MFDLDLETAKLILEKFDAISVVDTRGYYVYANQNWLDKMGLTAEELQTKRPWDLVPGTKVKEVLNNRKPIVGYTFSGTDLQDGIVSYYPIYKGDTFFGVLIWVFSTWAQVPTTFANTINNLTREINYAKAQIQAITTANDSLGRLTGESAAIQRLREEIITVSHSPSSVLIEGESGVGKDLVARSIHDLSENTQGRFVKINCAALYDNAEIELFGCEERYIRGMKRNRKIGLIEMANGGTVFFDEISQLPLQLQARLLEVLENGYLTRIDSDHPIKISARILASSSIPLRTLMETGDFNRNLYYQLEAVRIWVPPLRQRKEDIPFFIKSFLIRHNRNLNKNVEQVDPEVVKKLQEYNWPGNIKELGNVIESAMIQDTDGTLTVEDFMAFSHNDPNWTLPRKQGPSQASRSINTSTLRSIKSDLRYIATRDALIECEGNITKAAKMLGISRAALYKRIEKYDMNAEATTPDPRNSKNNLFPL